MRWRPILFLAAGIAGCHSPINYTEPVGPRYAGGTARPPRADARLRVVTLNTHYAERLDSVLVLLTGDPLLRDADVLLLQEMDAPSCDSLAARLGMAYVYYPSTVHPATQRDFGTAILSRRPIVADAKLVLPHRGRASGTRRVVTAATIQVGEEQVRVYSVHLGTLFEIGPGARRAQLRAVLADAAAHPLAIVGGDFNTGGLDAALEGAGFDWPTRNGVRTTWLGRWDHILVRGFGEVGVAATGTVHERRGASDHRPVWLIVSVGAGTPGTQPH
jgi:endonuclease/exonuclease/phosphatase family metal-dependent hydrolase